ncbi:MAG: hypothetical protein FJ135_15125 [Deltaproteobacteria bacterium]|nr:hypothetical protein [Deltaproteobacteria bacterium]
MTQQSAFADVVEAADRLTAEEKETLIQVLQRRLAEARREEMAQEIAAAREEFQAGQCHPTTPDDLLKEILE